LEELVKLVWLKDGEKVPATFNSTIPGFEQDVQRQRAFDDRAFSRIWCGFTSVPWWRALENYSVRGQGAQSDLLELR
jgi:hypothetical protein